MEQDISIEEKVGLYAKKLIENSLVFGIGTFIPTLTNIVLLPLYVRYLTTVEYGALALLNAFGVFLAIFMDLSISKAIKRFYIDYEAKERASVLGSIVSFIVLYAALLGIVLSFLSAKISLLLFRQHFLIFTPLVILQIWTIFFTIFSRFAVSIYVIKERSLKYFFIQLINFFVVLGSALYFLIILKRGLVGIFEAMFFSTLAMAIIYILILSTSIKLSFNLGYIMQFLKYSLPLIPHHLFLISVGYIDRFYINNFFTLSEVGIYSVGARFAMVMEIIVTAFGMAWLPFYYNRLKQKDSEAVFKKIATGWMAFLIFICLTLSLFAKEIIVFFTTPNFYGAYKVVPILLLGYTFLSFYTFALVSLLYDKRTVLIPFISAAACLLNILLLIILLPKINVIGSALAKASAYITMCIIAHLSVCLSGRVFYEYKRLLKIALSAFLIFIFAYNIRTPYLFFGLLIKVITLVLFFVLLGYFRVLDITQMRNLFLKETESRIQNQE